MDAKTRFRTQQLPITLEHARSRSKFYGKHLSNFDIAAGSIESLAFLPTISKSDLANHGIDFLTSNSFPERVGVTSGSSYVAAGNSSQGVLIQSLQSSTELNAWRKLKHERLKLDSESPRGVAIQLLSVMHGSEFNVAVPGVLSVPFATPFHYLHIVKLLKTRFEFDGYTHGVEYIIGSTQHLKTLVTLLMKENPELLAELKLKAVYTYSWRLTDQWRRILNSAFRAPVISLFGISEVPGSHSVECPECGGFHFPAMVIPEVLAPNADSVQLAEGVGELTLTSLMPFCELQPLIRYRTGDLVEIIKGCELEGDNSFRLRGRLSRSIIDKEKIILCSGDVFDKLDALADVSRSEVYDLGTFGIKGAHGPPKHRIGADFDSNSNISKITLFVELSFHPAFFESRVACLREDIESSLSSLVNGAAMIEVKLLPPGSLVGEAWYLE